MSENELIAKFNDAGQGQVFEFYENLSADEKSALITQAETIDLTEIASLSKELLSGASDIGVDFDSLQAAPYSALPENGGDVGLWKKAKACGEEALRKNKVAAFTVAGGQGTRLGYNGPKGTFPVTPINSKPLFQVFAEKILYAIKRYDCSLHWFIMTSYLNHSQTVEFFEKNDYFGLNEAEVHFFSQGLMPALTPEGKIMLESKHRIAMSPDGHGGALRALVRSGSVKIMQDAGVEALSYFQVDNPLVHCIDPEFVGFHLLEQSDMSSKMVPKAYAKEKVGNFCKQGDTFLVVEYSDLPDALTEKKDDAGELYFRSGSIAIHILSPNFIDRVGSDTSGKYKLPFHKAYKKISAVDALGKTVKPDSENGYKMEMFVFDALPLASKPVIIETDRSSEFSPVKNPEGVDSVISCKEDQQKQFARWIRAAGAQIETDADDIPVSKIEISPLFATTEIEFAEKWASLSEQPSLDNDLYIKP